jgi:hypothetical protein
VCLEEGAVGVCVGKSQRLLTTKALRHEEERRSGCKATVQRLWRGIGISVEENQRAA